MIVINLFGLGYIEIRRSMWDFLTRTNEEGTTIILTTHYLEEAEQLCKNIAIIDRGKIIKNTSMKGLLHTLHHQTFILNTELPYNVLPDLEPFKTVPIDPCTFELRVDNDMTLNEVFTVLTNNNIKVSSMRNKTNRLEELFLDLIKNAY